VDIRAPAGTLVLSVSQGIITLHKDGKTAESFIALTTRDGWQWRYFHVDVTVPGGAVAAGAPIGVISKGGASGPHLHLGLYDVDASTQALHARAGYVDPLPVLVTFT
jgi:murein DD-endopeptidase MepM/ murein hydrolase activator NlpD